MNLRKRNQNERIKRIQARQQRELLEFIEWLPKMPQIVERTYAAMIQMVVSVAKQVEAWKALADRHPEWRQTTIAERETDGGDEDMTKDAAVLYSRGRAWDGQVWTEWSEPIPYRPENEPFGGR